MGTRSEKQEAITIEIHLVGLKPALGDGIALIS